MNFILYLVINLLLNAFYSTDYNGVNVKNGSRANDSVVSVFTVKNSALRASVHSQKIKDFTLMQLDTHAIQAVRSAHHQKMVMSVPYHRENLELELTVTNLFNQDFKLITDQSKGQSIPYQAGQHFSGKIAGDPGSFVTLSIFDNELNGIISSSQFGNLNLGRSSILDPVEYILYGQDEVKEKVLFDCRTPESNINFPGLDIIKPQIDKKLESRAAGCVAIDFELTLEVYSALGTVTNSANWLISLFAGVKALYTAEGIDVNIKTIFVWTTEDGYSDDVLSALNTLRNRRINDAAFSGNLVHLVRGILCPNGCSLAGIAWLDGLCNSNIRYAVSEPVMSYAAYPAYSWSVNVLAHEMGHNLGSNHTHWCGWQNGPIDNCSTQEHATTGVPSALACTAGPSPGSAGGTIMSYCHNTSIGIKFSNGFGLQPGNLIRSRVNSATCLSTSCSSPPPPVSCTDGILNGTETSIDCGGSCGPCAETCPNVGILSQGKSASQSSNFNAGNSYPASMVVDGQVSTGSFNHTNNELQPWWQVDLGNTFSIASIEITHRTGCAPCAGRIKKFKVFVSETNTFPGYSSSGSVYEYNNSTGLGNGQVINIPGLTSMGRYVRIWVDHGTTAGPLHFAEVKVIGCQGNICEDNQDPTVSLSSNASSYANGSSFNIDALTNDPDGSIAKVEFYDDGNLVGTDNTAPFSFTVNPATALNYSFTAIAFDNCDARGSTSSILPITTTSSCSDGFQNGNETGLDCGGDCDACPLGCVTSINISQGKTASHSSNFNASNPYPATMAIDGSTSASSFNHTNNESQPWLEIDLQSAHHVTGIEITHRTGCAPCAGRIKKFKVFVSENQVGSFNTTGEVFTYNTTSGLANGEIINISSLFNYGRYVRIWVDHGSTVGPLHLAEVRVFGCASTVNPCLNNQSPTISLSTSAPGYPTGSSFTVNATVNDADGQVAAVEFYNGVTLLGTDTQTPFSFTINPANDLEYNLTAKAIDNCLGFGNSGSLNISTTSTCDDGFQNGSETGVDCGGACDDCPLGCVTSVNISQGKSASQSSNFNASNSYPATMAIDGSTSTSSFNHTNNELQPWLEVDLQSAHHVTGIEITHRTGCSPCAGRIKKFKVFVSENPVGSYIAAGQVYTYNTTSGLANGEIINISSLFNYGRYVRIWVDHGNTIGPLHLAEVKVFGCVSTVNPCLNNQPPTISLSTSAPSYPAGSSFTINATVNDPDGQVASVEFYNGVTLLGTDTQSPFSFIINPANDPEYNLTAKAIDNCLGFDNSSLLTVNTTTACDDGFQNGSETGVDCGGLCNDCPVGCTTSTNLSQGKATSQSGNFDAANTYPSSRAVDGSIASSSFNHTNSSLQPWWQVDLNGSSNVTSIEITHRTGCATCAGRIKKFRVFVTPTQVASYSTSGFVYEYNSTTGLTNGQVINITGLNATGQYVRVWVDNGTSANYLHFAEVKVMGCSLAGSNAAISTNWKDPSPPLPPGLKINSFPNPAREIVNFNYSQELDGDLDATVIDLNGRKLIQTKIVNKQLSIAHLDRGSYFIHLHYKGEKYIMKILKF